MDAADQFVRFVCAGSIAAIVDFAGYNAYIRFYGYGRRVSASACSSTLALACSFSLNWRWVFANPPAGEWFFLEFVLVTLAAIYCIQGSVICLLTRRGVFALTLSPKVSRLLSSEVLERNAVKGVALGVALIWNFCWYKWYVFA